MAKPIDSVAFPKRDSLTWAQQTYYWARYGLTKTGNSEDSPPNSLSDMNLPGSNDRLHARLEQSGVAVEKRVSKDTLIHTGPVPYEIGCYSNVDLEPLSSRMPYTSSTGACSRHRRHTLRP